MRVASLQPRRQLQVDFRGGGSMDREYNWRDEPFGFFLLFLTAAISFVALVFFMLCVVAFP